MTDDLISRQAAIDEFGLSEKTRKYGGDHSGYGTMMLYEIQDTLESLPSAQQWIPCSERLPEEDFWSGRGRQFSDHVFVTIVNHANDDEYFTDTAQTVDGIWQLSNDVDGDCRWPNWCEVIAWMPLPEPYRGEES